MTLEEIRTQIDRIDNALLPLFEQRMECAREVAKIKAKTGLPVKNLAREAEILDRVECQAGEFGGTARILFSTLMDVSCALQYEMLGAGADLRSAVTEARSGFENLPRVVCQGTEGAYSHQAARHLFPDCAPQFCARFEDLFVALSQGDADYGILPVENSSAGSVLEAYDLLLKYRFTIAAAVELPVNHCLAAKPGAQLEKITRVLSHPQGLSQCARLIEERGFEASPCANTAVAARMVAQGGDLHAAALCSPEAARRFGLAILAEAVQDTPHNCTRLVAVSHALTIPPGADKISLCFTLPHETGSLHRVLARFAERGLNLTKIESRPLAGRAFEYHFYLDFSGSVRQPATLDLLCALSEELPNFSFLGNYPETLPAAPRE